MHAITFVLFVILWLPSHRSALPQPANVPVTASAGEKRVIEWHRDVAPIFAARCQPCHFSGGVMHAKLPFDDPATIQKLGTKVFGRIRDEKEREVIRAFVARK